MEWNRFLKTSSSIGSCLAIAGQQFTTSFRRIELSESSHRARNLCNRFLEDRSVLKNEPSRKVRISIHRRNPDSRKALLSYRRSRPSLPVAGLRVAILGNRVSSAQASQEQHWPAHVSAQRC